MPLVIDGYNVLHVTGILPPDLAGIDVAELRGLIAVSRYRQMAVTIVCDGAGPMETIEEQRPIHGEIVTRYAGRGRDADSVIMRMVKEDSAPRRLQVVTSDRRVQKAARARRCRVISSEVFLGRLAEDHRRGARRVDLPVHAYELPLDAESVKWWARFFGCERDLEQSVSEEMLKAGEEAMKKAIEPPTDAPTSKPPPKSRKSGRKPGESRRYIEEHEQIDIDRLDTGDFL